MTIQHTPGPWTLHETVRGIRIEDSKTTVCSVFPRGDKEANARLIAAAPDLLAALRLVERQHEGRVVGIGQTKCECDVCAVVRAAIAKAEGT